MANIRIELKNDSDLSCDFGLEPEGDYFDIASGSKKIVELDTTSSGDREISFCVQRPGSVVIVSAMRKTVIRSG